LTNGNAQLLGRISLRPIGLEDQDFLYCVYASTRQQEMALVPWSDEQKVAFLQMQFNAQHKFYTENYPDAAFQAILLDGCAVGRLYLHRRESEICVVDIALLPAYRSQGIGTALLEQVLTEAQTRHVKVTIHVEMFNPALRLYQRLGFRHVADNGVYYLMEWLPEREMSQAARD
jgi:ribosomal protein S18 acetylase RimI-like enzyme